MARAGVGSCMARAGVGSCLCAIADARGRRWVQVAHERHEGVGGRHAARPRQQREPTLCDFGMM
eukprot:2455101-Rhodomonas_salina.1